ncbi:Hpt domain-containing protein [Chitinibacter sp. SCUT-21]|uniref:Hpt domain-containing protein n=1 Tax=Chitinibacter sp. SCUT-21 TaxID=2970891 RepID=UPI0035A66082
MVEFDQQAFTAGLAALKIKFLQGLPERMQQIEPFFLPENAIWVSNPMLLDELHRLAGAAGSLGFEEVAQLVRQLESRLKSLADGERLPLQEFQQLTQATLRALQAPHFPGDSHSHTPT